MLIIKFNPATKPLAIDDVTKKISDDFGIDCVAQPSDVPKDAISLSVTSPINLFVMSQIEKLLKHLYA